VKTFSALLPHAKDAKSAKESREFQKRGWTRMHTDTMNREKREKREKNF
jgi:hypothetical protein